MNGISHLTDGKGKRRSVVLDLKKYSKVWEDIYDTIIAESRMNEPRESYESVKEKLKKRINK